MFTLHLEIFPVLSDIIIVVLPQVVAGRTVSLSKIDKKQYKKTVQQQQNKQGELVITRCVKYSSVDCRD